MPSLGPEHRIVGLIDKIRQYEVPPGNVGLWWLGQSSFIVKSPGGTMIAIDPYLTDRCKQSAATE